MSIFKDPDVQGVFDVLTSDTLRGNYIDGVRAYAFGLPDVSGGVAFNAGFFEAGNDTRYVELRSVFLRARAVTKELQLENH